MFQLYQLIVHAAAVILMPLMYGAFCGGIFVRFLMYVTAKRQAWFALAFEKRVRRLLDSDDNKKQDSYYVMVKRLLELTYYESFVMKARIKLSRPGTVLSFTDRIFQFQTGCAQLVRDTLRQVQNLRGEGDEAPELTGITKNLFRNNQWFKKVIGLFSSEMFNEILLVLPGLFIIGGIFGTFLGIMQNLPELSGMDLADVEGSKKIMDKFLLAMSYAMIKSIIGIILSVSMTIMNGMLNVENIDDGTVNRFENCLTLIWHASRGRGAAGEHSTFDEHKDPIAALAEQSVAKELKGSRKARHEGAA